MEVHHHLQFSSYFCVLIVHTCTHVLSRMVSYHPPFLMLLHHYTLHILIFNVVICISLQTTALVHTHSHIRRAQYTTHMLTRMYIHTSIHIYTHAHTI